MRNSFATMLEVKTNRLELLDSGGDLVTRIMMDDLVTTHHDIYSGQLRDGGSFILCMDTRTLELYDFKGNLRTEHHFDSVEIKL